MEKAKKYDVIVSWVITDRCNEKCAYCFTNEPSKELTKEDHYIIQNKLIGDEVSRNYYTGGEALLLPHLSELIARAHDNGLLTRLNTNGILLTQEKLKALKPYLDQIVMPFDSLDDDINEYVRKNRQHRQIVASKIAMIKDAGNINLQINTCLNRKNINALDKLGAFLAEQGIDRWKIRRFYPAAGKAAKNNGEFEISFEEYFQALNSVKEKYPGINTSSKVHEDLTLRLMVSAQGNLYRMAKIEESNDDQKKFYADHIYGNLLWDDINIRAISEQGQSK